MEITMGLGSSFVSHLYDFKLTDMVVVSSQFLGSQNMVQTHAC